MHGGKCATPPRWRRARSIRADRAPGAKWDGLHLQAIDEESGLPVALKRLTPPVAAEAQGAQQVVEGAEGLFDSTGRMQFLTQGPGASLQRTTEAIDQFTDNAIAQGDYGKAAT